MSVDQVIAHLKLLNHSLGETNIQLSFIGGPTMYQDNSTIISGNGNNLSGNQFAAGSKDFQGTINNISSGLADQLEKLTNSLVKQLQETPVPGVEKDEVIDAVKQVEAQVKQKTINKISISGLLSGINMVIQNADNISSKVITLYNEWSSFIHQIIA